MAARRRYRRQETVVSVVTVPAHRYLILLRAVSDETVLGRRDDLEGTIARGLSWRMVDSGGILPNDDEKLRLLTDASGMFHDRFGENPTRRSLTCVPWFPTDGNHPSWREPGRLLHPEVF